MENEMEEPIYAVRRRGFDQFFTCDKERYDELANKPDLFEVTIFYTAPPKQPEQDPVAWVLHRELFWPYEYEVISENGDNAIPLYAAPPKREWVGLTDEDLSVCDEDGVLLARYWENKLREKNK